MADVDRVVETLLGVPVELAEAVRRLPAEPGLYAWWTSTGSIPGVQACPHPSVTGLDLFYVGISPNRATSSATLKSRVKGNHIGGNVGSSTFRLTLASLLFEGKGWQPVITSRPLLTSADNKKLTAWQHEHLRLTWAVREQPWEIEHEVIQRLQPPLNLAGNITHPFAERVSAARGRFKGAALHGAQERNGDAGAG